MTKPARQLLLHAAAVIIAIAGLGALLGMPGAVVALAASLLSLAWRYDNSAGTCFVLALLFLIVIGVMVAVMLLLLVTHPA